MTWIDWLFAPLAWLVERIDGQTGAIDSLGVLGVVALFVTVSVIAFIAWPLLAVGAHVLLMNIDAWLESAFRWSVRGSDLKLVRQGAERYVAVAYVLSRARSWTGVGLGLPERDAVKLPGTNRGRVVKALTRGVLATPRLLAASLRFLLFWIRHPLGAYILLGSVWLHYRPDLEDAIRSGRGVVSGLAKPSGLAWVAVLVAAAAVILDHGLPPRVRGRNSHHREAATNAEMTLSRMRGSVVSLVDNIDASLEEVARASESVVASAVEHVTQGRFLVLGSEVHQIKEERRRSVGGFIAHGPDWNPDDPLRHYRSDHEDWEPSAAVDADWDVLTGLVGEAESFSALSRQAPRPARALLWELYSRSYLLPDAEPSRPIAAVLLGRDRLEQRGHRIITDFQLKGLHEGKVEQRDFQVQLRELVRGAHDDFERDAWRVSLLRAQVERFSHSVESWQRTRGWWRRLGLRLG